MLVINRTIVFSKLYIAINLKRFFVEETLSQGTFVDTNLIFRLVMSLRDHKMPCSEYGEVTEEHWQDKLQ